MDHMTRAFDWNTCRSLSRHPHRITAQLSVTLDSTCRTGLLTDSTADTAYFTLFFCLCSFALVGTFDYDIIGTFMDMNDLLRTDFHTFSAGNAFGLRRLLPLRIH